MDQATAPKNTRNLAIRRVGTPHWQKLAPIAIHHILARITSARGGERLTVYDFRKATADAAVEAEMPLPTMRDLPQHVPASKVTQEKFVEQRQGAMSPWRVISSKISKLAKVARLSTQIIIAGSLVTTTARIDEGALVPHRDQPLSRCSIPFRFIATRRTH
ncbi:MAG: hypothetical protein ACLPID_21175 [Beijerinckiaceae bacterium]